KDKSVHLFPGMNCKVTFTEGTGEEALLVPKDAVQSEGDEKYVMLAKRIGEPERQTIKAGKSDDKMIQVLEGLSEGDKVLVKPAEKSQAKSEKPTGAKEAAKKE